MKKNRTGNSDEESKVYRCVNQLTELNMGSTASRGYLEDTVNDYFIARPLNDEH